MPTVRYGQRRVETEALPGVRRQAAETELSAGVGLAEAQARGAQALEGLGGTVVNIASHFQEMQERERKKASDTIVMAGDTALGKWEIDRVYDPIKGAYTQKGRDALGLPEQISQEFEQVASEIERGLTTNEQRIAFAKIKAQRALNLYGNISRHVSAQMQAYQNEEAVAKIENGTDLAISNALEPRRVKEEAELVVGAVKAMGSANGWGPDKTAKAISDTLNKLHVGVVEKLLDSNETTAASEHLDEAIKGGVLTDPKQTARLRNMVEKAGTLQSATKAADEIIAAGGTVEEQLDKAKKIERVEERKLAEQQIEHIEARRVSRENQLDRDALDKAHALVDGGMQVDNIPATIKERIPTHLQTLRDIATRRTRGMPNETDQQTFYNLMMKAATTPAEFADPSFNLMEYRGKLSDSDFQQLTQIKANLLSGNKKAADATLNGFSTKEQILESTLGLYGLDPRAKPDDAAFPAIDEVRRQLDQRLAGQPKDKIDNVVIQRELDDILGRQFGSTSTWFKGLGFLGGGFWGTGPGGTAGITFQGEQKRLLDVTVEDIPAADRQQIEAALRAKGKPVTPQLVRHYFITGEMRKQQQRR